MTIKNDIKGYHNFKDIKKIDHNTYLLDSKKVLLYNTVILSENNGYITVNNGGYPTVTTKDRINKFIDKRYTLFQKDFEWYIKDKKTGKTLEYSNFMKVKGNLNI